MGKQVGEKIEYEGQKLTNFHKKKDFSGQKNKLGLSLRRKKKESLGQKLGKNFRIMSRNWLILKKKRTFRAKKQAGAELKNKKRIFWQKLGEKLNIKAKNWPTFRKKGLFMPKNKLGLSLRRKKRIFWVQNWGKIWK